MQYFPIKTIDILTGVCYNKAVVEGETKATEGKELGARINPEAIAKGGDKMLKLVIAAALAVVIAVDTIKAIKKAAQTDANSLNGK